LADRFGASAQRAFEVSEPRILRRDVRILAHRH
jgi:hypothetical protein